MNDQLVSTNDLPVMTPAVVLEKAREAAQALQGVIKGKSKPVVFNGEQYLEFEDWQTLARFYGYTVETGETQEVWRNEALIGYTAKATVFQNGNRIGGAEASCLKDEMNWRGKPEFQLKSMAQTRAGSKALRNVLAWVAVLGGFKPTPAEEMQEVFDAKPAAQPKPDMSEVFDAKPVATKCSLCGTTNQYHKTACPNDPYREVVSV